VSDTVKAIILIKGKRWAIAPREPKKDNMRFRILNIVLLFCLPVMAIAQQATFKAYSDAEQVLKDAYFEVGFTLENGDGQNFKPPSFRNFKVVSGPSQSVSTTIINGKMSKEVSIIYGLVPKAQGRLTIGSAAIDVNGRTLKTVPFTIQVVAGTKGDVEDSKRIFITADPSSTEIWEGQQLPLWYKLHFSNTQIANISILDESEYAAFYAQNVRNTDLRNMREVINGIQYESRIVKKMVLFPQRTGTFTIEPFVLQLSVVKGQSGFFRRNIVYERESSEPVDILIKPLPGEAPANFKGSVGQFRLNSYIDKKQLSTDDAVTLSLRITGTGDIKRIQPPDLNLGEDFEVYDPNVIKENSTMGPDGLILNEKIFEYLFVPNKPGMYTVAPQFVYFDIDSANYVTLNDQVFTLNVMQGQRKKGDVSIPVVKKEVKDIRPIQTQTVLKKERRPFFRSTMFWVLCLLPLLSFAGALSFKKIQEHKANVDPIALKRKLARKLALKRMEEAEKLKNDNKTGAFYDEISRAMFGYVCDKLHIPFSELTKENLLNKLNALGVQQSLIEDFMKVIKNCEIALYAGMDNSEAMEETYGNSVRLLMEMEEGLDK
jgi:hypothetical protein